MLCVCFCYFVFVWKILYALDGCTSIVLFMSQGVIGIEISYDLSSVPIICIK